MKPVLVLSGPTATGKTATAVTLAQKLELEVVNFDSLLFYRELNIGTAKPTLAERADVPHHLIDVTGIADPMNAADFARLAKTVMTEIHSRGKVPLLVGGSGFYLQALLDGMWDSPTTPIAISERSDALYAAQGIAPFLAELEVHDRETFHRLHANDHYRIRRAVEHFWTHGTPFSAQRSAFTAKPPEAWRVFHAHLDFSKDEHLRIIQARTRNMLATGLVAEVEDLLQRGFTGTEKPLQAIGYKETLDWLQGVFGTDALAFEERIVINTRRLAKAQRTWFKKKEKAVFDPRSEVNSLEERCREFLQAGGP